MGLAGIVDRLRREGVARLADRLEARRAQRRGALVVAPRPAARAVARWRRVFAWVEELHRLQGRLVALVERATPQPAVEEDGAAALDRAVLALMRRGARLVWTHPVAAQAAFAALVAEGRAFAQTDEGARWEAALRGSPAIERAFRAFEMLTGNILLENPEVVLPSGYLDLLVEAAALRDLGPWLAQLVRGA